MTEGFESPDRATARKRLQTRRDFAQHLVVYLVINSFLVGIWFVTGAGYFWPAWVLGGWGIGLALHAWDTFGRRPITEADVDAEVRRMARPS
jgi:2TM domain